MKHSINFTKTILPIIVLLCTQASSCQKNGSQPTLMSIRSAVKKGALVKVKKCLDNNEDPNTPDEHGSTLLHWACYYCTTENSLAIIEALIQKGGNIHAQDAEGDTPLFWVIKRVQKTNKSPDNQIIEKVIQLLLKAGANINIKNTKQQTPLHWAVSSKYQPTDATTALIKTLLCAGADPNQKDCNQKTPLHYAVYNKDHTNAQILLQAGADPNQKDCNQQMPLHYAVLNNDYINAQILLHAGADPNQKDCNQKTPIMLAIIKQNHSIFQILSQGSTLK